MSTWVASAILVVVDSTVVSMGVCVSVPQEVEVLDLATLFLLF